MYPSKQVLPSHYRLQLGPLTIGERQGVRQAQLHLKALEELKAKQPNSNGDATNIAFMEEARVPKDANDQAKTSLLRWCAEQGLADCFISIVNECNVSRFSAMRSGEVDIVIRSLEWCSSFEQLSFNWLKLDERSLRVLHSCNTVKTMSLQLCGWSAHDNEQVISFDVCDQDKALTQFICKGELAGCASLKPFVYAMSTSPKLEYLKLQLNFGQDDVRALMDAISLQKSLTTIELQLDSDDTLAVLLKRLNVAAPLLETARLTFTTPGPEASPELADLIGDFIDRSQKLKGLYIDVRLGETDAHELKLRVAKKTSLTWGHSKISKDEHVAACFRRLRQIALSGGLAGVQLPTD